MSNDSGKSVPPLVPEGLNKLRELLARHLGVALSSMLGEQVETVEVPAAPGADLYWFRQAFVPLEGALWFGVANPDVVHIGEKLLSAAGLTKEPPETAIQTFGEILGQGSGALAADYAGRLSNDVRSAPLESGLQRWPETPNQFALKVKTGSLVFLLFVAVEGSELLRLLVPHVPQSLAASAPPDLRANPLEGVNTRNLDLLLDVELPISVSFGRSQLQLKDVIKLTTGSIVELNRSVSEPVDIIVNNCVIARGEIVVVEGNFGVRIKQIVSKQERLKTVS